MSVETPETPQPAEDGENEPLSTWKMALPAILIVLVVGVAAIVIAHASTKPALPAGETTQTLTGYDGLVLRPLKPAPALDTLHNYNGEPFKLADFHGKAAFVTFLYTHCPDVCPLIASQLHNVLVQLGPDAAKVGLVAVSVDPRGDTRSNVEAFLHEHGFSGQMKYLTGTAAQLAPVWQAWNIGAAQDVGHPEFVNHSAAVYGISASGKLTTIYAAPLIPSQLIHDVKPLLQS